MEVYALLFVRKSDEELFVECWGVFDTKKYARSALLESYWELRSLYKATHMTLDEDFALIETIDGKILELKIDTTTYYAEVINNESTF